MSGHLHAPGVLTSCLKRPYRMNRRLGLHSQHRVFVGVLFEFVLSCAYRVWCLYNRYFIVLVCN